MKSLIRRLAFSSVALLGVALHAQSGSTSVPMVTTEPTTFDLSFGGFVLTNIRTTVSLSPTNGSGGTDVDFNNQLGVSSSATVFRADAEWRFAQHHKLEASWFSIKQDSTHTLDRTINWGDQVYPVTATVNSHFNNDVYKLDYGYVFYSENGNEWAALIGAHITRTEVGIGLASGASAQNFSVTAPLPVLGLEWKGQFSEKWSAKVSLEYFGLSLEDNKYSGHLTDFLAVTDYRLTDHWSIGGGYNRFDFTAKLKSDRVEFKGKRSYNGLLFFVAAHF